MSKFLLIFSYFKAITSSVDIRFWKEGFKCNLSIFA
jgi:hypothetical protein